MKPLGYLSALGAAGVLGAAVILACSNPAVSTPPAVPTPPEPATPPQGALTLVYATNNRIKVTKGKHLMVPPTLTPRAAKVKYSAEGAPDWLNIHPTLGVISASARRIQGAFSSADPSGVRQDFRFRILAAGTKGAHARQSVTADLVLTVNLVSLPAGTYPARTVSRAAGTAARTITAPLTGGLTAADADFAFDAATPRPAWLTLSDTGTIAGVVPANADTAAYKINVTGKGSYAGAADQVEFVLTVNSVRLPGMSYTAKTVNRLGNAGHRRIWVGLSGGLPATQAAYAFEPPSSKPAWLSVGDTGIISGTVPTNATLGSTTYTVKITGKGSYAGAADQVEFVLTVNSVRLPGMSYTAKTVNRLGNAGHRRIWVGLSGGLPATQAAYAFEPPSSKPAWLSVGDTGIISGTVPTNATLGSTTYTVKITGKGIYAGETGNVTFTLDVISAIGVTHGSSVAGSISAPGERHHYSVALGAGQTLTAYTTGSTDTFGIFKDSAGTSLATNDDGGSGRNFRISHTVSAEGTYYIIVRGYSSKTGNYQLNVSISGGTTSVSGGDFDTLRAAGNGDPHGIWSDGTTMWVSDWQDDKIYAYSMSTKARESAKDFNTLSAAGNGSPEGIWSDGTTMWVPDRLDDKIYAYSMSTKARESTKDFNTLIAAGNREPFGLWSDGTTMWVSDWQDDKIYAYSMSTKARDSAKDFNTLAAGNRIPVGLWSDGTTMWVADYDSAKIYAYSMSSKARESAKDFNTLIGAGNRRPVGIWSNGTTMWVPDTEDDKIYAYSMSTKERTP